MSTLLNGNVRLAVSKRSYPTELAWSACDGGQKSDQSNPSNQSYFRRISLVLRETVRIYSGNRTSYTVYPLYKTVKTDFTCVFRQFRYKIKSVYDDRHASRNETNLKRSAFLWIYRCFCVIFFLLKNKAGKIPPYTVDGNDKFR